MAAGIVLTALLLAVYARGGMAYPLGFVFLVPWLLTLNASRSFLGALVNGWLMSIGMVAAAFMWLGVSIHTFFGVGEYNGILILLIAAPIFQPQILPFVVSRYLVGTHHGPILRAVAGASAWVAAEWLAPKLLDDSIGYGVHPSLYLRQIADLCGAAGITFMMLLINEALTHAIERRREGARALIKPIAFSATVVIAMFVYGVVRLSMLEAMPKPESKPLRIGLVQSNLYNYERMQEKLGVYGVIRLVLDTHFRMSAEAVEVHGADAVLWPESVYPTTFDNHKNEFGAKLDQEIFDFVSSAGVPLMFGTYDVDKDGEYVAAALVEPKGGTQGFYRKSIPFLFTEYVPPWLDGPMLRWLMPGAGSWKPGNGVRVFPLRLADGREIPVLPLLCLDETRVDLSIEGARQGAQVIMSMSNDSWFQPLGGDFHLATASFRSIETRMPQVRVTQSGITAAIDPTGTVTAVAPRDKPYLLIGEVAVRPPPPTLMRAWGDWVGRVGLVVLLLALASAARRAWRQRKLRIAAAPPEAVASAQYRADVIAIAPAWRILASVLRIVARLNLLWIGIDLLFPGETRTNDLTQIGLFFGLFLVPEAAAWAVLRAHAAKLRVGGGLLTIEDEEKTTEIPARDIAGAGLWAFPLPDFGLWLSLASGKRWSHGIVSRDPAGFLQALLNAGASPAIANALASPWGTYVRARAAVVRGFFDRILAKFVIFPFFLSLPAFRLHQVIAYGGTFGEYYTYGLKAYLLGLLIWWAKWAMGMLCFAAALRVMLEVVNLICAAVLPGNAASVRKGLELAGRLVFYIGVPAWLLIRLWPW